MSLIHDLLCDESFAYLQPYFYNHPYALRCELGIGDSDEAYLRNARSRALAIYHLLFPKGADAIIFNYWMYDYLTDGAPEEYTNIRYMASLERKVLQHLLTCQKKYRHRAIRNLKTYDEPGDEDFDRIRRHRILCYSDGKPFPFEKIIDEELSGQGYETSFVSFENDCILSIYDDRGCDIVFAAKEKMKEFYPALEPYFLAYDLEEMQKRAAD